MAGAQSPMANEAPQLSDEPVSFSQRVSLRTDPPPPSEVSVYEGNDLLWAIHMEGISRKTWAFGVCTTIFFVFLVARWPEHTWVGLLGGDIVLIPLWYYHVTKYRKGWLFIGDLCWIANLVFVLFLALHFTEFTIFTSNDRFWFYVIFYMQANAYLGWSVVGLNQGLIFHSNERMTSLFCHIFPCIVTLCMRTPEGLTVSVQRAWPGFFPLSEDLSALRLSTVFLAGWVPYLCWFFPYSIWAVFVGIHLPDKGWATVFDNIYKRMMLKPLLDKTGFTTYRSHLIIYLFAHFMVVTASYAVALIFWQSYTAHFVFVCAMVLFSVWSGNQYFMETDVKKFGLRLNQRDQMFRHGAIETSQAHFLRE